MSEQLNAALLKVIEDNRRGVLHIEQETRSSVFSAMSQFEKPRMPNCAICRKGFSSVDGNVYQNWQNHLVAAEERKDLSEKTLQKKKNRNIKLAKRRERKRQRTE